MLTSLLRKVPSESGRTHKKQCFVPWCSMSKTTLLKKANYIFCLPIFVVRYFSVSFHKDGYPSQFFPFVKRKANLPKINIMAKEQKLDPILINPIQSQVTSPQSPPTFLLVLVFFFSTDRYFPFLDILGSGFSIAWSLVLYLLLICGDFRIKRRRRSSTLDPTSLRFLCP